MEKLHKEMKKLDKNYNWFRGSGKLLQQPVQSSDVYFLRNNRRI